MKEKVITIKPKGISQKQWADACSIDGVVAHARHTAFVV